MILKLFFFKCILKDLFSCYNLKQISQPSPTQMERGREREINDWFYSFMGKKIPKHALKNGRKYRSELDCQSPYSPKPPSCPRFAVGPSNLYF